MEYENDLARAVVTQLAPEPESSSVRSPIIAFRTMRAGDPLNCAFSDHLRTPRLWSRGILGAEYRPALHRVDDVCLAVAICFSRKT